MPSRRDMGIGLVVFSTCIFSAGFVAACIVLRVARYLSEHLTITWR